MKQVRSFAWIRSFCFSLVITGCGSPGNSEEIRGKDYAYSIPTPLISNGRQTPFGGAIVGDDGNVVSLLFGEESGSLAGSTLLIFWDRTYDTDVVMNLATTRLREVGADLVKNDAYGVFEFTESVNDTDYVYFTTFDPRTESNISTQDFFAQISRTEPYTVGGRAVQPQATCRIYLVIDGLLFQVGRIGEVCSFRDLLMTAESVRRLTESWRVSD